MWRDKKVSVVLPTYNEKDSIRECIEDLLSTGCVDEVLVIDNNAVEGTAEEVGKASARLVHESQQGYGFAVRRGFKESSGDLIVVSEPDGTFSGHDVLKLLTYSDDFPLVFGSRTVQQLIWRGANMGWFLRLGNMAVAKAIQLLFNCPQLTDVGCTMRLIKREALAKMKNDFTVGGSHFGPEMILLAVKHSVPFIQIPVNYRPRVGVSSVTGSKLKALLVGMQMIGLILAYRFGLKKPKKVIKGINH